MARRKRKDDEADWVAPEFDEVGYMRTEIEAARTAVFTIGWALLGAIVSFALFSVHPVLAFFGGIGFGFGLYFMLPLMGFRVATFKRKDWIGHGVTYFFSWLAFWILFLNPPFGDFTSPTIHGISAAPSPGFQGTLTCVAASSGPIDLRSIQPANTSITVLFRATDNVGLSGLPEVTVSGGGTSFTPTPTEVSGLDNRCRGSEATVYPDGTYNVTFDWTTSSYAVTIVASDRTGRAVSAVVQILA